MSTTAFDLGRLRRGIKPFRLHWFPRLRSTNDHAAAMRKRGELFAPAIVLTGCQIAGRGRYTNTWWSGPGSLTVTFVLAVDEQLQPHHVPLIAGLATRNALAEVSGVRDIQLKWPNDLLYADRKLGGLLCQRVRRADLIGVGVNVNADPCVPRDLRGRIVAISEIADRAFDKTDVLIAIARHVHELLSHRRRQSFVAILREYDQHHGLVGRRIRLSPAPGESAVIGTCRGLDQTGRLLVRQHNRVARIIAGQVDMY